MEVSTIVSVALAWAVVVLVPGPDFLATAQAAAGTSRRAGIAVVAGIALATTIWALAAVGGLAAVFRTSAWIYDAVRLAGAAYLIVLGIGLLASARRPRAPAEGAVPSRRLSMRRAFVRGLVTDLSNPKAAVFFTSLFAVAIPPGSGPESLVVVVALMPAIAALWYGSVAVVLASGPLQRAYRRAERAVLAVAGALLAAFGVRLALER